MTTTGEATAGTTAADCELLGAGGARTRLSALWTQRPLALVFLPDDESPYCADNAALLRDSRHQFDQAGASLAAVLPVGPVRADAFAAQLNLSYPVLADEQGEARAAFGVGPEQPAAVLIDTQGKVRYAHHGEHAEDYPSARVLLGEACAITGKDVPLPPAPPPRPKWDERFKGRLAVKMVADGYQCGKCGNGTYELHALSAGGVISQIFDAQAGEFTAITCSRCTFTEIFRTPMSAMSNVLETLATVHSADNDPDRVSA